MLCELSGSICSSFSKASSSSTRPEITYISFLYSALTNVKPLSDRLFLIFSSSCFSVESVKDCPKISIPRRIRATRKVPITTAILIGVTFFFSMVSVSEIFPLFSSVSISLDEDSDSFISELSLSDDLSSANSKEESIRRSFAVIKGQSLSSNL